MGVFLMMIALFGIVSVARDAPLGLSVYIASLSLLFVVHFTISVVGNPAGSAAVPLAARRPPCLQAVLTVSDSDQRAIFNTAWNNLGPATTEGARRRRPQCGVAGSAAPQTFSRSSTASPSPRWPILRKGAARTRRAARRRGSRSSTTAA